MTGEGGGRGNFEKLFGMVSAIQVSEMLYIVIGFS